MIIKLTIVEAAEIEMQEDSLLAGAQLLLLSGHSCCRERRIIRES